jgi:hypothetical protein
MPSVSATAASAAYCCESAKRRNPDHALGTTMIFVLLIAITATVCSASACETGPLSTYLTYPYTACSIGNVTFSNFTGFISSAQYDGTSPGYPSEATPGDLSNPANLITVVPTDSNNIAGFSFQGSFYSQGYGGATVLAVGYQVSAPASDPLIAAGVSLSGAYSSVANTTDGISSSGGDTNGTLALCENGGYTPFELPLPCSPGSVPFNPSGSPQITSANQTVVYTTSFGSTTAIGLFSNMQLFSYYFDYAGASAFNSFVETTGDDPVVPEPGAAILTAIGLMSISFFVRLLRNRAGKKRC